MTINTENRINETIAPDDMIPGYVQDNPEVVVAQQPEHASIAKAIFDKMQQSPQLGENGMKLVRKKIEQSSWSATIFRYTGKPRISDLLSYVLKPTAFIPSKLYRRLDLPLFRRRQKPSFLPEKSGKSTVINSLWTTQYQQTMGKQLSPKTVSSLEKGTFSGQETQGKYKPMHSDLESIPNPSEDQLIQYSPDLTIKKPASEEGKSFNNRSISAITDQSSMKEDSGKYPLQSVRDSIIEKPTIRINRGGNDNGKSQSLARKEEEGETQLDAFSRTINEKNTQANNNIKVGHSEKSSTLDKIDKYTEKPLKIIPLQKTVESDKKAENTSKSRTARPMVKPNKTDVNTPFDTTYNMYKKNADITRDAITDTSRESTAVGILGVEAEGSIRSLSLNRNKSFSDKAISRISNQSSIVSPTILKTKTIKDSALPILAQQVKLSGDNQTAQSASDKLNPIENNLKTSANMAYKEDVDIYDHNIVQKSEESRISPDATDSLDVAFIDKPIERKTRTRTAPDLFGSNKLVSNKTNISKAVDQTASTSVSLSADIRQSHKKQDKAVESYKTGLTEDSPPTHEVYKITENSAIACNHDEASDIYTTQGGIKEETPSTKLDEPLYFTKPIILNSPDLQIFHGIGNIPGQITSISRRILKTTGQKPSSVVDESEIIPRDIRNLYMTSLYRPVVQHPLDFPVVSKVNRELDYESSHSGKIQCSSSVKPHESIRNDSYGMPDLALVPVTRKKEPALDENTMVNRQELPSRNDREDTQNIRVIADKVYALLRQELKIERERERHRLFR